ncbi:hypothetical protein COT42_04135 [Candidatus Saganbacteria bacterium CG08_land_8_20_14_0_20_45_16]|uniref:Uncharacterized protein n=1 Tax=Candidatus Saganbacteria bacterium CG08_land_8_20_14_0_20_45_16 TaxID=2014293 RepID=A0A2H0XYN1_UNCSA|nr:MAG: hypothetical protein COT42_04135 [Candidatus Saganbacteria bacterium CG08_land_8_20_14_0_20_45_16]
MKTSKEVSSLLKKHYGHKHVDSILKHFEEAISCFRRGDWEKSIIRSSKFVEAVIKLICVFANIPVPSQRQIKFNQLVLEIQKLNSLVLDDALRLQITRAFSFVYDVASNRGARHDQNEIDPNEMDATVNCSVCSWVLAELFRLSSKGALDIAQASLLVDGLIERQYPIFDNIDGRIYIKRNMYNGATECALFILYYLGGKRISKEELFGQLDNNGINRKSVNFGRLKPYVDIGNDGMVIRSSGKERIEQIIKGRPHN